MTTSKESRISALPAHLRERLRSRLAGKAAPADTIPAVPRTGPLPLSAGQQRLWFLHQFEPGDTEYNSALALRLRGSLDVSRLTSVLRELVLRHESLRTTFDQVDGQPVQVVHADLRLDVPVTQPDDLDSALRAEVERPFDLEHGPLFRASILRVAEDDHVLLLASHHIVVDGWSLGVLADELGALYRGEELPPIALQYADFAVWQRQQPVDPAYWRDRLTGVEPLELPTDRPRPAERTSAGATHEFVVPTVLASRLADLARAHEATLFTTLLAACQVLLARYTGQDDIAIGTVTSGRGRPELQRLVGFFVGTVVVRSTVDTSQSFEEFLATAKADALDAFAHDDVPFDRVVEAVAAHRDPSRTPLFDVMVAMQNVGRTLPELPGLTVAEHPMTRRQANFDLTVDFTETDAGIHTLVEYRTDLFDPATIDRLGRHLLILLARIVADSPFGYPFWHFVRM